ncbi:hypothetical protein [Mixta mediterraneensis]|uniref:hypothetical protein n=1 Tax=Mixta mediterraneensis TaxID=2758443 RepID=UPI001873E232|nr:hypothetical protein [Mixta mediterraneensis]
MTSKWGRFEAHQGLNEKNFAKSLFMAKKSDANFPDGPGVLLLAMQIQPSQ